jgi:hypothetical protein
MKPSIDQQIEAVEQAIYATNLNDGWNSRDEADAAHAALSTLRWVKLKTKPALGSVMEAFPGAKVVSQDDEG